MILRDVAKYVTLKKFNYSNEIYLDCDNALKPTPGMTFNSLKDGMIGFYKNYVHHVGYSVLLSLTKLENGITGWKYCVCSKDGWHK